MESQLNEYIDAYVAHVDLAKTAIESARNLDRLGGHLRYSLLPKEFIFEKDGKTYLFTPEIAEERFKLNCREISHLDENSQPYFI